MLKILAVALPVLIDIVNSNVASTSKRFWISAAICAVFGLGVDFVTRNGLSGYQGMTLLQVTDALSESVLYVFGLAQLSYKAVWENKDMLGGLRDDLGLNAKTK